MSNDLLISLLRRCDERSVKAAAAGFNRCLQGPSLSALYFHIAEGIALPATQAVHVPSCPTCARVADRIRRRRPLTSGGHEVWNQAVHGPTHRFRRWVVGLGGLAVAASIILAVVVTYGWRAQRAFAQLATSVAQRPIDESLLDSLLAVTNPAVAQKLAAEIESATQRRDAALARLSDATTLEDRRAAEKAEDDLVWARVHRYRGLRDIGRFDEALAECHAAVQEASLRTASDDGWQSWLFTHLDDLGSIHAAQGEYGLALDAYRKSIALRIKFVGEPNTAERIMSRANTLTPLFWRLSYLAMIQGDYAQAQQALDEAEVALRLYTDGLLAAGGGALAQSATLVEAFRALPAEFQQPPQWPTGEDEERFAALATRYGGFQPCSAIIVKFREHYLRVARLNRVRGDFEAGAQAFRAGRSIPYYGDRDESRLDFFEPLESTRIAIAQSRFDDALTEIAAAEQRIEQLNFYGRPLGLAARAEFEMLKGVSLLGKNRRSQVGKQLVRRALALPRRIADSLPPEQQARFLKPFESWDRLLNQVEGVQP